MGVAALIMHERNNHGTNGMEKALELNRLRFEALYELSQMVDRTVNEIKDFALEASLRITGSTVGYIYFMSEDETELSLHAWSRSVMDECSMPARQTVFKVADTGLWGEAARLRKPVITNDYAAPDPRKRGCPDGHVPVRRHMNIPLLDQGRIVLIAGVGNKVDEYGEEDVRQLTLLMDGMWRIIRKKQADEALLAAVRRAEDEKARSNAIIAALGEGLVIRDREYRVIYQNEMHTALIGDSRGEQCYKAYYGRDRACDACPVDAALGDGQVHAFCKVISVGGREVHLEVTASPVKDAEGTFVAGIELVRDVTERKHAEEAIRTLNRDLRQRAAELAAMNGELEAFNYSLSHDLKGPLTGIYTAAQALDAEYGDVMGEKGAFFIASMLKSSERMEEIIDAMLMLGRVGRSDLNLEQVDLSVMSEEILLRLAVEHPERSVAISVGTEVTVTGDPHLMRVVLENLLGNAWKYTQHVRDARIEFGVAANGGERVLFVRDNGAGFDMAHAAELFVPFRRLHDQREFEGTGVGLATVQRIVQRHGGRVWGEGEPGRGASFHFTLGEG
jgi:signal transduction histidine kinase